MCISLKFVLHIKEIYISKKTEFSGGLAIFLHPVFADHRTFDEQLSFFESCYKIITVDLIGHGLSQDFKIKDKIDNSARHIKYIMYGEGYDKAHLIGVSIGSLIAKDFANKYPENVLSLTAVGGYDINNNVGMSFYN